MKRRWRWLLAGAALFGISGAIYVWANPLVFNESLWRHAHCMKIAGLQLEFFAADHDGKFPSHPKGYGNALLLLDANLYFALTGPGYTANAFHEARRNNRELSEDECGRVYVQGLTKKSNPEIALLFDKQPTPGGDHCHFPVRLWAPLGREVWTVGGGLLFVRESEWPALAKKQVELLVQEGFERREGERLFASPPK
jgi:hypothetical protein